MKACNTTLEDEFIVEDPLWDHGLTFHHLGLIISAAFGLISVVLALWLIFRHATHYSRPWEQKHIIRILFMIPIYSTVSFLSYLNYRHAIYYEVLRDCYEAFAIASFFTLMCHYIAPTLHEQKEYFRSVVPKNWFWSVFGLQKCTGGKTRGPLRIPRSGLTWFNVIWVAVFQYCLIRVLFTIVSVITQHFDRYCAESLNPVFAHIWVMAFEAASVTVAMFCLVQFYIQLKEDLAPYRPALKIISVKLVIFFSFWQTLVISFLSSDRGPLHPTSKLAYQDIKIGISSTLLCVEMAAFSILHIFAFPYQPYRLDRLSPNSNTKGDYSSPTNLEFDQPPSPNSQKYLGGPLGIKAIADAFNPWDIIKASARGFRWLFVGRRARFQDSSYSSGLAASAPAAGSVPAVPGQGSAVPLYAKLTPAAAGTTPAGNGATGHAENDTAGLLRHTGPAAAGRQDNGVVAPGPGPERVEMPERGQGYAPVDQGYTTPPPPAHAPHNAGYQPQQYGALRPAGTDADTRIGTGAGLPPHQHISAAAAMPSADAFGGMDPVQHGQDAQRRRNGDGEGDAYNTQGYFSRDQTGIDADAGHHGGQGGGAGIGMAYGGEEDEWRDHRGQRHYGDRY